MQTISNEKKLFFLMKNTKRKVTLAHIKKQLKKGKVKTWLGYGLKQKAT